MNKNYQENLKEKYQIPGYLIWFVCVLLSLALIYVLLITSFEIVAYGDMKYYQKEYEKYDVAENLNMDMDHIMFVTGEMMDYLRGDRANLIVETIVDGEQREFFNESEISHMEDVQELFIAGIDGRRVCIGFIVGMLFVIALLRAFSKEFLIILARAFRYTTIGVAIISGIVGGLFAIDFNKYFEVFHKIFFEGDTWLFNPDTSLMINMLPEGLFYDMTLKIVVIFLVLIGAVFVATFIPKVLRKKN